jgi:hypothetical protein
MVATVPLKAVGRAVSRQACHTGDSVSHQLPVLQSRRRRLAPGSET